MTSRAYPRLSRFFAASRQSSEQHRKATILDSAIVTAATLAHRCLTARRLPDSAIDALDEACSGVRIARDSQPEEIDQLEHVNSSARRSATGPWRRPQGGSARCVSSGETANEQSFLVN